MRRHYANYLKGLSHGKQFRNRFVNTLEIEELNKIFDDVIEYYSNEFSNLEPN
jgi:hypothetical protein